MRKFYKAVVPEPNEISSWRRNETTDYIQVGEQIFISKQGIVFLCGNIFLPIEAEESPFVIECWIQTTVESFLKMQRQRGKRRCVGTLISSLPFYGKLENISVECYFKESGTNFTVPGIKFLSSDLDIFHHQKNGIPRELYLEWMKILN